ncbi:MAG: hypothetical protein ABI411_00400 [Tahibacter sp.]
MNKPMKSPQRDNRDPLSGATGAHPLGTGVGAAIGGSATGAAIGAAAGPAGAAIGAAIGAVVGGLAGKGLAESFDPTAEDAYWRSNYVRRPYATGAEAYDAWAPAYQHGWESRLRYHNRRWDDVEAEMRDSWTASSAGTAMEWNAARPAVRDAWDRVGRSQSDRFLAD